MEVGGAVFEDIPESIIVRAALVAASEAMGDTA
jgi:hypothetical protein